MATHDEIRRLKDRYGQGLLGKRGVAGVGIEKDERGNYALIVHLADASAKDDLPDELEGEKLRFVTSGPFVKLPALKQ